MAKTPVILHAFWLSSCSWRARAALHYKGIRFEERSVDIVRDQSHLTEQYRRINPGQKVPALEIDGVTLVESMAILQYLEDTRSEPTLTPSTPLLRARMREVIETIVSGIAPLQNIGLKPLFKTDSEYQAFGQHWALRGLQTLEELLQKCAGQYCVGDQLSMADLCFVPQLFNATGRLQLDISKFPTVSKLYEKLLKEKLFKDTHPKIVRPQSKV